MDWMAEMIQVLGIRGNRFLLLKCQTWFEESHLIMQRLGIYALHQTQATNVNTKARVLYQSRLWQMPETHAETLPLLLDIGREAKGKYLAKFTIRIRQMVTPKNIKRYWGTQIIHGLSTLGNPWKDWAEKIDFQEQPKNPYAELIQQVNAILEKTKNLLDLPWDQVVFLAKSRVNIGRLFADDLTSRLYDDGLCNVPGSLSLLQRIIENPDFPAREECIHILTNIWATIDHLDDAEVALNIALMHSIAWKDQSRVLSSNLSRIISKHPTLIEKQRERILPWAIQQIRAIATQIPQGVNWEYSNAVNSEWGSWYALIQGLVFWKNAEIVFPTEWKSELQDALQRGDRSTIIAKIIVIVDYPKIHFLDPDWTLKFLSPILSQNIFAIDSAYLIFPTWYDNLLSEQKEWLIRITCDRRLMTVENVGQRFSRWLLISLIDWKLEVVKQFLEHTDSNNRREFFGYLASGLRGLQEPETIHRVWVNSIQPIWEWSLQNHLLERFEANGIFRIITDLQNLSDKNDALNLWKRTHKREITDPFIYKGSTNWWDGWDRAAEYLCTVISIGGLVELTQWMNELQKLIPTGGLSESGWRMIQEAFRLKGINWEEVSGKEL
jgi:hypothetical protein